jgi:signal peptidase II
MNEEQQISSRKLYFLISLTILILDQASKLAAIRWLAQRGTVEVIPSLFNLTYSENPGGLFGYFGQWPDPWRTLLLTALPMIAIGMIAWFLARGDGLDRRTLVGLSLILGGAVGNLIDRLIRQSVVDFLDVYAASPRVAEWLIEHFGTAHWPTFNVADSAIVTGAGLLLLTVILPQRETTGPPSDHPPATAG